MAGKKTCLLFSMIHTSLFPQSLRFSYEWTNENSNQLHATGAKRGKMMLSQVMTVYKKCLPIRANLMFFQPIRSERENNTRDPTCTRFHALFTGCQFLLPFLIGWLCIFFASVMISQMCLLRCRFWKPLSYRADSNVMLFIFLFHSLYHDDCACPGEDW